MSELISIIVPTYNVEKYIKKCITSISAQTYKNIEILIIDDGSSDDTLKILNNIRKSDQRIRIISQSHKGVSVARNTGIKKAKGKYIVFVDGDDMVNEEYVKRLVGRLKEEKSDIVVCGFDTIRGDQRQTEPSYDKTITGIDATIQFLTKQDNLDVIPCNKIYKKSLFADNEIFYPEGDIFEDTLTTYKIYSKANKISYISDSLYYYYKRKDSITTSVGLKESIESKLRAAKEAQEHFSSNKKIKEAAKVTELLAYYSFIDAMLLRKIPYEEKYFDWIKNNKKFLQKNQFLTTKLKIYLLITNTKKSTLYKLYRKITL